MVKRYGDRYIVGFNIFKQVSLRPLMQYVFSRKDSFPLGCITALDIFLRTVPMHNLVYTSRDFSTQTTPEMSMKLHLSGVCT